MPVHTAYMAKRVIPRFKPTRKNYIREWRKHRGMTLEALADAVGELIGGMTHASLSRIERSKQPHSEPILEAIAYVLKCHPADLLIRDPSDPEGIWSIWDQAKPGERLMIVELAKTLRKTGT